MTSVYKVVRVHNFNLDGCLFRSAVETLPNRFQLFYRLGKETRTIPGTIGIFAFLNFRDAKTWKEEFGLINQSIKVLECDTKHMPKPMHCIINPLQQPNYIQVASTKDSFTRRIRKYLHYWGIAKETGAISYIDGACVIPSLTPKRIVL